MTEPYYSDDLVTLYHGDAREVLSTLTIAGADLVLTDPPYGIGWSRGIHAARRSKPHSGILNDHDTSTRDAVLSQLRGIPAIVFGSFYAPFPENTKQVLVWKKPDDSGVVGSVTGYRRDVEPVFLVGDWPMRKVRWSGLLSSYTGSMAAVAAETGHPHTKPIGLIRSLIERSGARFVVDPFTGSGTVPRACKDLGVRCIAIELDEGYCETTARRLSQAVLPLGVGA